MSGGAAAQPRSDWTTLKKLLPYVWQWRWRVGVALSFLVAAKLANVGVPLVLKQLVDALDLKPGDPRVALTVPVNRVLQQAGWDRAAADLKSGAYCCTC